MNLRQLTEHIRSNEAAIDYLMHMYDYLMHIAYTLVVTIY